MGSPDFCTGFRMPWALVLTAFVLGGVYGYSVAIPFAPGAEWLAGLLLGLCATILTGLFWRIWHGNFRPERKIRMTMGALSLLCAVPCAVFVASALFLVFLDPAISWQNPGDVLELSIFMVRFTLIHVGFITMPVAALAGAFAVAK